MKRVFIEAKDFQKKLDNLDDADLLRNIQESITKDPEVGVLVKGTGGLRKFRMGAKGKGKSGGIRVFYLDIATKEKCYLLFVLEKSESDNISAEEKNELKELAGLLKK
ncbi:MAG: type II toxin-antitoxin system RelE/ParE family toxin [Bdellovibrionota bacterium]